MIKKIGFLGIFLSLFLYYENGKAQLPYFESFKNTTAPGINFGGSPTAFLTAGSSVGDANGSGYLRLTNNTFNQKGYIYSDIIIPSNNGLKIEFEYFTYGGNRADGITFFLFDAATSSFNIGGFGGSLGYAPINLTTPVTPGVSNGYLGIGIDEYGNFSNPTEGRQGGPGFFPESVTIRGKGNGAALTPDNYKFLTTAQVKPFGFGITGGVARHPLSSDPDYRKALIDLRPNALGGYNISVRLTVGGSTPATYTIIDNYYYPEAAPAQLRYGLASSTGSQNNFHEIRNVKINPFVNTPPVAVNDAISTVKNTAKLADVIANDTDIDGSATIVSSSLSIKSNPLHGTLTINPSTFNVLYTPAPGYIGPDSFTYTIKDSDGAESNIATVAVQVVDTFEPVAINDNANTVTGLPVIIDITANDTGGDGTLNKASIVASIPVHGTLVIDPVTGKTTYTPTGDYHGRDIFIYTIRNSTGLVSNVATVTINVRPRGSDDNAFTKGSVPVTIAIKDNDISKNGSAVLKKSSPLNGTVVFNADGTVTYTPNTGFFGSDIFTYSLIDADNLESDPITVNIITNNPPIAVDDNASTFVNRPVVIDVIANDTDADGTVNKASVAVTIQPLHGTVAIDPLTGKVTYTPIPGYKGPDSFTYTVKDDKGQDSNPAKVNIIVKPVPKVGLAKSLVSSTLSLNGSYDIKYLFTITNFGQDALKNASLRDDLAKAFDGAKILVKKLTALGTLQANPAFDGTTVVEMLEAGGTILPGTQQQVELEINVTITRDGLFSNTAFVEGTDITDGSTITDQSTNGLKPDPLTPQDVTPSEPTLITLQRQPLYIPEGFSPNGDGTNDMFVIRNANGQVTLEIFNRWGNRVYHSSDYQNTWDGKCTEGLHIGQDVPNGTYYYIAIIDSKDKYVGHITLNR